jgi:uncharacterized protein YbjT (DUF2867 family)
MRVVIAGGHGKIALRLERLLAARGDHAVGLIRNPEHVNDVTKAGASAAVIDLEASSVDELVPILRGADAVVFAAGAGPGSGAARKDTVDRAAAVLLADAAVAAGVPRYLLVSATGVDSAPDPARGEVWLAYLAAKKAAEVEVAQRDLKLVVLRPGPLTDDIGAGRVALAPTPLDRVEVTRDDVAAVLLGLILEPRTDGLVLELMGGEVPITAAIASVLPG